MRRLAVLAVLVLVAAPATAQSGRTCPVTVQNLFVREVMRDLYLWSDTLPEVDPRRFPSPEAYLEAIRHRPLDDRFSYIASAAATDAFYDDSQFIGYGFSTAVSNGELVVLQVFPESPAAEAGLSRGDRVVEIDGQPVSALIADGLIDGAFGPPEAGVSSELVVRTRAGGTSRQRLEKRLVTIPTVSLTRVLDVDGRRVGYLFFRNFVRPSVAALDEAFRSLAEAGVSELVLDLRYNGGGLVEVATHLAGLIGGPLTEGQPFARYAHNPRNVSRDRTLRFAAAGPGVPRLSRLIAITTRASASASELVLNGLRPFLPVVIIGAPTYGKPVGQYLLEFCDKVLAPVSFSMRNANDQGDYFDGLPPTCAAPDDATRDLGDPAEASLAEALHYIRHDACSTTTAGLARLHGVAATPPRATGWQSVVNAH